MKVPQAWRKEAQAGNEATIAKNESAVDRLQSSFERLRADMERGLNKLPAVLIIVGIAVTGLLYRGIGS